MRISDFIEESNRTDSPEALFALMERAVGDLGFNRYAFCALTRHDRYKVADSPAPAVALNYPTSWTDHYFEHSYQKTDPVLQYAPRLGQQFRWDLLEKIFRLNPSQRTVMKEGREAGLLGGVGVPMHGVQGNFCLLTCAAEDDRPRPASTLSSLTVLATQFHAAYSKLCNTEPDCRDVPSLTGRERECLQWVACGKGSSEIAYLLHVSESTVNFHVKKAFRKLKANNRIAAVVNAIRFGLISL